MEMIRHGNLFDFLSRIPLCPPLSTQNQTLDFVMAGGIHPSVCYEINGVELTGKTTWCLQRAADAIRQGFSVIFFNSNNTPVREIVPKDISIVEGLSADLEEYPPRIIMEHIFSTEALLIGLRNVVFLNTSHEQPKRFFIIIDALSPLLMIPERDEEFDTLIQNLKVTFFQLKANENWTLAIANGERHEMEEDIADALDELFDAAITLTWHEDKLMRVNQGSRKCGPSIRLTRSRQGLGSTRESKPIQLEWQKFGNLKINGG